MSGTIHFLKRLPQQLLRRHPFGGDYRPSRIPLLFKRGRPSLPFPHPWNYQQPIDILETYFLDADTEEGPGRHNRYLDVLGFPPVLVTRDPAVIRPILAATGEKQGQFERDTLPSTGIARATGADTLLFGNGAAWRRQRQASVTPFGKNALFNVDVFCEFEDTFRQIAAERLMTLRRHLHETGSTNIQLAVESEIKHVMLAMLVNCFFGAGISHEEIAERYVPALQRTIDHIVRDTVLNQFGLPRTLLGRFSKRYAQANKDFVAFNELTDRVLTARSTKQGLWKKFQSDAPDEALRSNIKVFLAGALEATTSFASWAISHLARHPEWQDKVYSEVAGMDRFEPERLGQATQLNAVLNETLRLTPSLYFLPRRATCTTRIDTSDGRHMIIPTGTHVLLDIWHANHHEDHWGQNVTGHPAMDFAPARWLSTDDAPPASKHMLHFGFGHGQRICPGKHLGQLEVALVVGVFTKLFQFSAKTADNPVKAGVSTKPADGCMLDLSLRPSSAGMSSEAEWEARLHAAAQTNPDS